MTRTVVHHHKAQQRCSAGAAASWPLAECAQPPVMPIIGFVSGGAPDTFGYLVSALSAKV